MADPHLRALLEARHRATERLLHRLDTDERSVLADRSDGTADDEHDPEGSTLSGEWARLEVLRRTARADRVQTGLALARMDAGTFGICAACGRVIPRARLLARPEASHCVSCAAAL